MASKDIKGNDFLALPTDKWQCCVWKQIWCWTIFVSSWMRILMNRLINVHYTTLWTNLKTTHSKVNLYITIKLILLCINDDAISLNPRAYFTRDFISRHNRIIIIQTMLTRSTTLRFGVHSIRFSNGRLIRPCMI